LSELSHSAQQSVLWPGCARIRLCVMLNTALQEPPAGFLRRYRNKGHNQKILSRGPKSTTPTYYTTTVGCRRIPTKVFIGFVKISQVTLVVAGESPRQEIPRLEWNGRRRRWVRKRMGHTSEKQSVRIP